VLNELNLKIWIELFDQSGISSCKHVGYVGLNESNVIEGLIVKIN
jgi:hypothetical protein